MTPDAVYLCTIDQLAPGADDDQAMAQMQLLGDILHKLGFQMMSGVAPDFHQIWARPILRAFDPPVPDACSWPPAEFERQLLAWIHISFGTLPVSQPGMQGTAWSFPAGDSEVVFEVSPSQANADHWMIRIDEMQPVRFLPYFERHFSPGAGVGAIMPGGRVRMMFWSSDMIRDFEDQTNRT